jgi:hypothetical protein
MDVASLNASSETMSTIERSLNILAIGCFISRVKAFKKHSTPLNRSKSATKSSIDRCIAIVQL